MPPSTTAHVDLYNIIRETRTAIAYAKSHALDSLLDDLENLAREWAFATAPDIDEDKAPASEPVDADEFRALVRPAPAPAPEPEPEEFAVVRAAPAAAPETPPEPPKRPRRRTPPPAAPLPGPVDEAVEGASESTPDDDGFGSIPF